MRQLTRYKSYYSVHLLCVLLSHLWAGLSGGPMLLAQLTIAACALHVRPRSASRLAPPRCTAADGPVPSLVVLDLDMCVWSPEMYELDHMPSANKVTRGDLNGRGEGVTGVYSGHCVIRLFPGALVALQESHDHVHEGMKLAVASSADTPLAEDIGRAAMKILEVVPGTTVHDVLTRDFAADDSRSGHPNLQIGRQPPLSADKSRTHFPALREATGVPYDEMLFFDDSMWSDHCAMAEANCPGIVTQRTPRGMQEAEWRNGLRKFAAAKAMWHAPGS